MSSDNNINQTFYSFSQLSKYKPADYQQAIHLPEPFNGNYFGDTVQTYTSSSAAAAATTTGAQRIPHGKGIFISQNGQTRYGGLWNRGKRHGRGTLISPAIDYEGEWWEDAMHGNCVEMKYKSTGGLWSAIKSLRSQPKEYSGEIHRDHGVHGKGKMLYTSGELYEGEWYQGKRNGRGVQTTQEGERYEGQFEDDQRHGTGVLALASGAQYLGMFHNGRRHGHGKMLRQNGDIYVGEFNLDEMQGNGVMTYKNGDTYSGEWKYNTRHGRGIFKLAEKGALVSGTFVSGLLQGDGTVEIPGKSIFIGEFLHGERVFGTMWLDGPPNTSSSSPAAFSSSSSSSSNQQQNIPPPSLPASSSHHLHQQLQTTHINPGAGGVYHGPFKGDGVHGRGLFWYPDGSFYSGEWFNGKRQGWGYMRHADGTEYSGEFFADERHGRGLLKLPLASSSSSSSSSLERKSSSMLNNNNKINHSMRSRTQLIACGIFDTDSSISVGYFGEWDPVRNELCGRGTFIEENGATYEGLIQNSRRELLGSITIPVELERMDEEKNSNNNTNEESSKSNKKEVANTSTSNSNKLNHSNDAQQQQQSQDDPLMYEISFKNWPNMVTGILSKFGTQRSRALKNFFAEMEEGNSGDYAELLIKERKAENKQQQTSVETTSKNFHQQQHDKSNDNNNGTNDEDDDEDEDASPARRAHLQDFGPEGKKSTVAVHTVHLRIKGAASSASCRVHQHSQLEPPSRRQMEKEQEKLEKEKQHNNVLRRQKQQNQNNDDASLENTVTNLNLRNNNENNVVNTVFVPHHNNPHHQKTRNHQSNPEKIISCYIGGTSASTPTFRLVYRGGFVADAAHGEGTLTLEDEKGNQIACYCGLWAGGEPCGTGVLTGLLNENRFFSGDWLRGRPQGYGTLYDRGTDITSPLPELPVQSSNAIMRLFQMRSHSQAEAEAARLAKLRRGVHRLPHIVISDWYAGENHGNTVVFLSPNTTLLRSQNQNRIACFSLLHGKARLIFPHAPKEIISPSAPAKPDEKCALCNLSYGLLRVPVRCRCCARLGCSSCCETTSIPPHVPTVVLEEFTKPDQAVPVRFDDRMSILKNLTLSTQRHIFDSLPGSSSSLPEEVVKQSGGLLSALVPSFLSSSSSSSSLKDVGTASAASAKGSRHLFLDPRNHLLSSTSAIAREKLTVSARVCEMCRCAIEEELTKVTMFEETDLVSDNSDSDNENAEQQHIMNNEETNGNDEKKLQQQVVAKSSSATAAKPKPKRFVSTENENEKFYLSMTEATSKSKILKGCISSFCDKDGRWTDVSSVWNRVALNLCQHPKQTAKLKAKQEKLFRKKLRAEQQQKLQENSVLTLTASTTANTTTSASSIDFTSSASLKLISETLSNISQGLTSDVQYQGQLHNSKRNGFGTLILNYLDGEGYRGHWKNDLRDGEGIYRFPVHRCEELVGSGDERQTTITTTSRTTNASSSTNSLPDIHLKKRNKTSTNANINVDGAYDDDDGSDSDEQEQEILQQDAKNLEVSSYIGISGDWKAGNLIRLRYRGEINPISWKAEGKGIGFLYEERSSNHKNEKENQQNHQKEFDLVEVYNGDWKNGQPHGVGIVTVVIPPNTTSTSTSSSSLTESQFIGFFENGKRHGPGKSLSPSTASITHGMWRLGVQEGRSHIESPSGSLFGVMHNNLLDGPVWEQFLIPLDVSAVDLQDRFEKQLNASSSATATENSFVSTTNSTNHQEKYDHSAIDAGDLRTKTTSSSQSQQGPTTRLVRRLLLFTNGNINNECLTQAEVLGQWTVSTTTACQFCGDSFGILSAIGWGSKDYCRCCARVACSKCMSRTYRQLPEHLNSISPSKEENAAKDDATDNNVHQHKLPSTAVVPICTFCESILPSTTAATTSAGDVVQAGGVSFGALVFADGLIYCGHIDPKSNYTLPHANGFGLWFRSAENAGKNQQQQQQQQHYVCGSPLSWRDGKTNKKIHSNGLIKGDSTLEEFQQWWKSMIASFNIDLYDDNSLFSDASLTKVLAAGSDVPSSVKVQTLSVPHPQKIGVKLHDPPSSSSTGGNNNNNNNKEPTNFFTHRNEAAILKLRDMNRLRLQKEEEKIIEKRNKRESAIAAAQNRNKSSGGELDAFFKKEAEIAKRNEKQKLIQEIASSFDLHQQQIDDENNYNDQRLGIYESPHYCKLFKLPKLPTHPADRPQDPRPLSHDEVDIALRNARNHAADQLGVVQHFKSPRQELKYSHLGPTPPPAPPLRVPFTETWTQWETKPLPKNCLPRHLLAMSSGSTRYVPPKITATVKATASATEEEANHGIVKRRPNTNNNLGGDDDDDSFDEIEEQDLFVDHQRDLHNPFLLPGSEGCLASANAAMVDSPNFSPPPINFLENIFVPNLLRKNGNVRGLRIVIEHEQDGVGAVKNIQISEVDDEIDDILELF